MYFAMSGTRFLFRMRCSRSSGVNSAQSRKVNIFGIALSFMRQAKYTRWPIVPCIAGKLTFMVFLLGAPEFSAGESEIRSTFRFNELDGYYNTAPLIFVKSSL